MRFLLVFVCFAFFAKGEVDVQKLLVEGVQTRTEIFEKIEISQADKATFFNISLGKSELEITEEAIFDGFRFIAPEGAENMDFIWYFTAPRGWQGWYLCPVVGEFKRSFQGWYDADKVYRDLDGDDFEQRLRILQSLPAGYFESGKEYVLWFSRQGEAVKESVRGALQFVPTQESWSHQEIEESLGLQPQKLIKQVEALKSRGGEILLDSEFFTPDYARGRIDSVFFSRRQTRQFRGGFFITMKIGVPNCTSEPSLVEIEKRYGKADFVQTARETKELTEYQGGEEDEDLDEAVTTYYFDYFGFEVKEGKVVRVQSQASDFGSLREEAEDSFGVLSMKNLTTFYREKKEVGRLYYFRERDKQVLMVNEPPRGKYRSKNTLLEYQGDNSWVETKFYSDDRVASIASYRANLLSGASTGFYQTGEKKYEANYQGGQLHGKVTEYLEDGTVNRVREFRDGKLFE